MTARTTEGVLDQLEEACRFGGRTLGAASGLPGICGAGRGPIGRGCGVSWDRWSLSAPVESGT